MSIVDKVIAAVTPPERDQARLEARAKARAAAPPGSRFAVAQHLFEADGARFLSSREKAHGGNAPMGTAPWFEETSAHSNSTHVSSGSAPPQQTLNLQETP